MKLQIAFDIPDLEKCIKIAKEVEPFCDRFEIGAILLCKYGIEAIKLFRSTFPEKELLAETHIIERGKRITNLCLEAGANWVTVMAGAQKQVVHNVCSAAKGNNQVMLDLSDTTQFGQASMDAQSLGVNAILFHKEYQEDDHNVIMLDQWEMVKGNTKLPVYVSSGINRDTIKRILLIQPNGIIIGKAITEHDNPAQEAEYFYTLVKNPTVDE